jgi:hypothetical protein
MRTSIPEFTPVRTEKGKAKGEDKEKKNYDRITG